MTMIFNFLEKCPYSKNGKCQSCKVLSVDCDGERFWLCTQYELASGKITEEELIRSARTYTRETI